jgi:hypothetical protein
MRTVNYSEVLQLVSELAGMTYSELPSELALRLRGHISRRFRSAWECDYWPELTRTQERHYRGDYASGTTYSAPTTTTSTEVFYPPTKGYYQVLRASTGNAPATLSSGAYSTNTAYWYAAQSSYSGNDWAASTAYTVGTVVRYPDNNRYYSCHTAHTSSSTFDTTKFGILTPFDKYIAHEQSGQTALGEVRDVYSTQPTVNRNFSVANWTLSTNGVQVPDGPAIVWLVFRTRFVPLTGSDYSASATYAVGDQILFNSSGSVKNFYTCATATSAGESPNTAAAKWTIIEIPYLFQPYLVMGAYADYLRMDGQNDKAGVQDKLADEYLAGELQKLHDLQPQYQRLSVANAYPASL